MFYIAYDLFRNRMDPETSMSPAIRILFMVFFVLAGIALFVYAVRVWKKAPQEEKEKQEKEKDATRFK